jgi:hypothetical protein
MIVLMIAALSQKFASILRDLFSTAVPTQLNNQKRRKMAASPFFIVTYD